MRVVHRYIFGLFVLLILFPSCANLNIQAGQKLSESRYDFPENLWFSELQEKALYKINIEAFHQKQGGVLMVKQSGESSLRLLMVTEFGLKVFDVEYFKGDSVQVHYIMKHLDNPYIVNALFDNLKVFWPNILTNRTTEYFYSEKKKEYLYRLGTEVEQWNYLMSQDKEIRKIERSANGRKKASIQFDNQTEEILIKTKRPSISIRLKKITDAEE